MKALHALLSASLLTPTLFCLSQTRPIQKDAPSLSNVVSGRELENMPFAKGNWQYLIRQNGEYSYMKNSENGQSPGHQNTLGFDLGANYFVADRIGVGLELDAKWTGNHYLSDNTTSRWMTYGDIMYGLPVTPDFDVYGKLSVGIGMDKTTNKSGSSSITDKDNLFGYKIAVGGPIRLFDNAPIYLTPQLSWDYCHDSFDGGYENDNGFHFGACLEAYMGCNQFMCDCHHGFSLSHNVYEPGNSFIDFSTRGGLDFGTQKTYISGYNSTEVDNSRQSLDFGYGIYIAHNIAIGGSLELGGTQQKDKNSSTKVSDGDWLLTPMVEFNMPVDNGWNNSFLQLGLGFGSEKSTSTTSSTMSTEKDDIFNFSALLGYNDFIGRRLAFVPKIGYEWNSMREKSNGIDIEVGLRLFMGAKWK